MRANSGILRRHRSREEQGHPRVTMFGIFLTPVFFYLVRRFSGPAQPVRPEKQPE